MPVGSDSYLCVFGVYQISRGMVFHLPVGRKTRCTFTQDIGTVKMRFNPETSRHGNCHGIHGNPKHNHKGTSEVAKLWVGLRALLLGPSQVGTVGQPTMDLHPTVLHSRVQCYCVASDLFLEQLCVTEAQTILAMLRKPAHLILWEGVDITNKPKAPLHKSHELCINKWCDSWNSI